MSALPNFTPQHIAALTDEEAQELYRLTLALNRLTEREKLYSYYPDEGPLRRGLYPRHTEFFAHGAVHKERLLLGGNRAGKSFAGSYEVACHLIGWYPHWWVGKRFVTPTHWIVAGDTARTTRDIIQEKLLGPPGNAELQGTGMIPQASIARTIAKAGVPDAVENAHVKHSSGGMSLVQFRSYDQGREIFQGTSQHGVWIDEEADQSLYVEALMRTMTTDGVVLATMTPLQGLTPLILSFLPDWSPSAV